MNFDSVPAPLKTILLILVGAQYLFNTLQALLGLLHSRKSITQKPHAQRKRRLSNTYRSRLRAKNTRRRPR